MTVRLALEDFLPPDHFARTGGAALVLGSGGAGCALSHQFGVRADRPSEIICTDRLDHLRDLHARSGTGYFVHGWSQVVADVFAIPMPRETVQELADIAATSVFEGT